MYEVVEAGGEWIVRRSGLEVARYAAQSEALQAVAERMRREASPGDTASFAMRFGRTA
jgi:hypothetical protein